MDRIENILRAETNKPLKTALRHARERSSILIELFTQRMLAKLSGTDTDWDDHTWENPSPHDLSSACGLSLRQTNAHIRYLDAVQMINAYDCGLNKPLFATQNTPFVRLDECMCKLDKMDKITRNAYLYELCLSGVIVR